MQTALPASLPRLLKDLLLLWKQEFYAKETQVLLSQKGGGDQDGISYLCQMLQASGECDLSAAKDFCPFIYNGA